MKLHWGTAVMVVGLGVAVPVRVQAQDSQTWMNTMVAHENLATDVRGRYMYLSEERSERTGGHLWKEWVAETDWGKVRFLIAEDGQPLTGPRLDAERGRLADEAARPEAFKQSEQSKVDSEQHARQMLVLLPKAFLFEAPRVEGDVVKIDYKPNPDYQPLTMEEKVLHAMSGTVVIDTKLVRLRRVEGKIYQDVSLSFGFASVKAGSNFMTTRQPVGGSDWKLQQVHTDIRGKALFLKLAKAGDTSHSGFRKISEGLTVGAAVEMVERQGK